MTMQFEDKTIDWLYNEQLRVDPEWSIRTESGFTWWAHQYAQTIEVVGEEVSPEGELASLVGVRTQVCRKVPLGPKTERFLNAMCMPFASMAGPVLGQDGRVFISSVVRVHEGIRSWMAPLISMAAALQLREACAFAELIAKGIGGEPDTSAHPESGRRRKVDEIGELVPLLVIPTGRRPSAWQEDEFEEAVESHMQGPPSLMATAGGAGFTVEFPYGDASSLMQANADDPHPAYGNGLVLRQSFPLDVVSESEGIKAALRLNAVALTREPSGYGFGSHCFADGCMHFVSFLPNACYRPGLLPNLYFAGGGRARHMAKVFRGEDWESVAT